MPDPCPECGGQTIQRVHYGKDSRYGRVYFVDSACLYCSWQEIDEEGGV